MGNALRPVSGSRESDAGLLICEKHSICAKISELYFGSTRFLQLISLARVFTMKEWSSLAFVDQAIPVQIVFCFYSFVSFNSHLFLKTLHLSFMFPYSHSHTQNYRMGTIAILAVCCRVICACVIQLDRAILMSCDSCSGQMIRSILTFIDFLTSKESAKLTDFLWIEFWCANMYDDHKFLKSFLVLHTR